MTPSDSKSRPSESKKRFKDPILGTVKFTSEFNGADEYACFVRLGARRVEFSLCTDESGNLKMTLARAHFIVDRFPVLQEKIQKYVKQQVYPTYNEIWRKDKKPRTFDQVMRKLNVGMICVYPRPPVTFYFLGNDLFQWHNLELTFGPRYKIVDHSL